MYTAEQIKSRLTPDVLAFAEKTFNLLLHPKKRHVITKMDEVLFYQTVSLAYTHGRCDANNEIYAGLRQVHGVK